MNKVKKVKMSLFVAVLFVVLGGVVSGEGYKINNAKDFVLFSNNVNNGTSYSETTVFLESDIGLNNIEFEPTGVNSSNSFRGVFDGQGYVIRNLVINSSAQYVGLFGHSSGLTIRNVVLDESCSVEGSYNSSSGNSGLGGIIGNCYSSSIENSVNMASVTFRGNVNTLHLGGIIGYIYFSKPGSYVKNCVNYGSVAFSGSGSTLHLGGIVGYSQNPSSTSQAKPYIQNCINYGTLSSNDALTTQNIGGIVGCDYYGIIENCVSAGRISSSSNTIGNIIGLSTSTNVTHSFWTSDVGCDNVSGYSTPSIGNETSKAELDVALWNKLNSYSVATTNTSWLLLHLNGGHVNSNTTKEFLVSLSKRLPVPKKEWHTFAGWFVDPDFNEEYEPDGESRSTPTDIYAKFTPNNYTVSFNVSGGDELSVILSTKEVAFNTTYGKLPTPTRTGYTFLGWFTDANESVTNETIVSTPSNHTLYAHWEEILENHVEITFSTKDLSKKDIEKIVRQYTDAEFTIVEYEKEGGSEGTKVIIRFTNAKDAVTFVEVIRESSDETRGLIHSVGFIVDYTGSFSSMLSPILFFYLL